MPLTPEYFVSRLSPI